MKTNQGDRNTNQPAIGIMQSKVNSAMARFRWAMPTLLLVSTRIVIAILVRTGTFWRACSPKRPNQSGGYYKSDVLKSDTGQNTKLEHGFSRVNRGLTIAAKRFLGLCSWAVIIWTSGATLTGCTPPMSDSSTLNSRYTDEQPSLSGNGQFVAFVSSRDGANQVLLYDLKARTFVALPGLNSSMMIAQNPSLSRNARYIAYLANNQGKLDIFVYDRLTQRPEVVTLGYKNLIRRPALSPDGRYLVFETDRRGQWDIEVIDRGTGIELDKPEG